MKRAAIGLGVVTALFIVGVLILYSSLGAIITKTVNTVGPKMVLAKVKLKKTEIDATSGKGSMHDLFIGNPKGFKTDSALKLNTIHITLDPDSITSQTVLIREINIQAPEITYELGEGGSNLDAIQRNVDAFVKAYSGPSTSSDTAPAKKSRTRMVIDHLTIKGGKVNLSAALMGGKAMTLQLSDIHLTDIGKQNNGATSGQVVKALVSALNQAVLKAVNPLDLNNIGSAAGKVVTGAKDVVQGTAKGIEGTLKKGTKGVSDAVSGLLGK